MEVRALKELVEVNPETIRKNYPYDKIEYIDIKSVGSGYLIETKLIPLSKAPSRARRLIKDGDTILSTVRPNRRSFLYIKKPKSNVVVSTGFAVLRAKEGVDPRYLYYAITDQRFTDYLTLSAKGAAYPAVDTEIIKRGKIPIWPIDIQQKIASILSTYDDLIENNTRRIQILEEMAQLIYREWFVNFRFPGHEKVKFVNSELGEIPEGWEVVKLEDIIENVKEKTEAGEHLKNREYLPIDCIPRKSFLLLESQDYTHAKSSLILFNRKDILFGNMRSYFHKVIIAPFDGVTRTTCFVLRPRNKNYLSYAYLTLFNEKTVSYSAQHSKGSTIPYAVWEGGLAEMKIIMPSRKIIDAFEKIISPILEISINTFFKLRNLRTARDLLLPKLISGEIDVSNWEVVGSRW
ncbi:MAG: hypothetical protein DRP41_01545 [Thermodesulfobacteriota bacterium]|nr:MAG: hypothetical protein DRP41_01545 [Thermodesulfobacteriota bacterium]